MYLMNKMLLGEELKLDLLKQRKKEEIMIKIGVYYY